jgi:hypothetical protein
MRLLFAGMAAGLIPLGLLLFADPDTGSSLWPWELTDLTAQAVGTWLTGIGIVHGMIAIADDRSALPGNALADLVLAGGSLLALARLPSDVDLGAPGALVFLAFLVCTLLAGSSSALICLAERRFQPARPEGGLPVELVTTRDPAASPIPSRPPGPAVPGDAPSSIPKAGRRSRSTCAAGMRRPSHLAAVRVVPAVKLAARRRRSPLALS